MGIPPVSQPPPEPAQDSSLWWAPNAIIAGAGIALCTLGVFGHADQQELITAGIAMVSAAGAHAAGKQSPTP